MSPSLAILTAILLNMQTTPSRNLEGLCRQLTNVATQDLIHECMVNQDCKTAYITAIGQAKIEKCPDRDWL